jgi:hypothetical protein
MNKGKMDMSGCRVTLDLNVIDAVLDNAVYESQNRLHRELQRIQEEMSGAHDALRQGNSHGHYLGLCHANTARESLVRAAQNLADAIHVKFHVAEAITGQAGVTRLRSP